MKILSVCTNLPTQRNPLSGLFVQRRLEMLSRHAELRSLNPQTWFPLIKPRVKDEPAVESMIPVDIRPMFYIPKYAKNLDGMWMERCVGKWLDSLGSEYTKDAILDAHFGYPEGVGCYLAAKKRNIPVFITIRGLEVDLFQQPKIAPKLVDALRNASGVIAVSHSLRGAAISAGVEEDKIMVIPNGVDSQIYSPGSQRESRKVVSVSESAKLIVCVASLKKVKGHDILIRALAEIPRDEGYRLVCIGSTSDRQWYAGLQALVAKYDLASDVEFVGAKDPSEVIHWLRACDVFALASRREGCCNAVLEALSVGAPVVATDVGDNANFVSSFCGAIVASGDHVGLAKAITRACSKSFDQVRIAKSMTAFTWSNAADQVVQAFSLECFKSVGAK